MTHRHGAWNQRRLDLAAIAASAAAAEHGHRHVADAVTRVARHDLEQITADAWQWSPGVPAASTDPKVGGSSEPRLLLSSEPDWAGELDYHIDRALHALKFYAADPSRGRSEAAVRAVDALDALCWTLTRPDSPEAVTRAVSVGVCACCQRTVPGTPNDRLRAGLCEACRAADRRLAAKRPGWDRADRIRHMAARKETVE